MRAVFMLLIKGGSVQETLVYKFSAYSKFEFSVPVTLCLPFWEVAFSVSESLRVRWASVLQWGTQLCSFKKKEKKTLSSLAGKFKFAPWWEFMLRDFSIEPPLNVVTITSLFFCSLRNKRFMYSKNGQFPISTVTRTGVWSWLWKKFHVEHI